MAVAVIEGLEVVEVDHSDRHGQPVAPGAGELPGQRLVTRTPVGQRRQRVGAGQVTDLVLRLLAAAERDVQQPDPRQQDQREHRRDAEDRPTQGRRARECP